MNLFRMFRKTGASLILLALTVSALAQSKAFDVAQMDASVEACDDFFQYANGSWVKNTPIPPDRSTLSSNGIINERTQNILRGILETASKNAKTAPIGSNVQLIGDLYASCMDEAAIEIAGAKPIEPFLKQIEKIKDSRQLQTVIAALHKNTIPAVFNFGAGIDQKNSNLNIAAIRQGGLSLPNRDYYLNDKLKDMREKYAAYVANMFALLGEDASRAKADAETVLAFQTRLANASKSQAELRNPDKNYNKISFAKLQKLVPNFDWNAYLATRGAPKITEINAGQPAFLEEFNRMLADVPLTDWKTYLRWMTISGSAVGLSKKFSDERFNFYNRTLRGINEQAPRWKQCVDIIDYGVGEALGAEYVKKNFPPEAKKRMNDLVDNFIAAYRERIGRLDWMSEQTKAEALLKLNAVKRKIGYDENPRGYKGLKIDRKSYNGNLIHLDQFQIARELESIGKPVDKTRWEFTPSTVTAAYNPVYNEINFPAGILQPPFFNFAADDAINYGAIGFSVGHEITHGFDDQGSKYDAEGNLKMWWTPDDRKKFEEKATCISNQFSEYEVLPGIKINGDFTLSENIADLGGLSVAYDAFKKAEARNAQPTIDGFTPEQRFFLGFAQSRMFKATPEALKLQVQSDPHANARFRVNGTLSNMPEFAEAFQCKIGKPMVRDNRCQIW